MDSEGPIYVLPNREDVRFDSEYMSFLLDKLVLDDLDEYCIPATARHMDLTQTMELHRRRVVSAGGPREQ